MQHRTYASLALFLAGCTPGFAAVIIERPQPIANATIATDPGIKQEIELKQWKNAEEFFIIAPRLQQTSRGTKFLKGTGSLTRWIVAGSAAAAAGYGIYKFLGKDNTALLTKITGFFEPVRAKLPARIQQFPALPESITSLVTTYPQLKSPWIPTVMGGVVALSLAHAIQRWIFARLNYDRSIDLTTIQNAITRSTQQGFSGVFPPQIEKVLRCTFYEGEPSADRKLALLKEIRMLIIDEYYERTSKN